VNVRTHRTKFLTGIAATALALASSIGPSFAQSGPTLTGSWLAGPDGKGSSTVVGRIETPRARATANNASNVLVSGWAADTTATGWAGIDGVEVWNGASDKSGSTKIATGTAGLARTDVGDALGGSFINSGFTAIVKSGALQGTTGPLTLFVYLHTPGKGTWYRTVAVNVISTVGVNSATGATLAFPNDPIVVVARPHDGMAISQKQRNGKFSMNGFALDRNVMNITDPNIQLTGPGCAACNGASGGIGTQAQGAGISSLFAYVDTPPVKGDNSTFGLLGGCTGSACMYANILTDNGFHTAFNVAGKPFPSIITRQFGSQFDFSGWSIPINPSTLSVGPHTLFITATSSVTGSLNAANQFVGKTTTATVAFNIVNTANIQPDPLTCTGPSKANHQNSNC
jgi:hypothetical protein